MSEYEYDYNDRFEPRKNQILNSLHSKSDKINLKRTDKEAMGIVGILLFVYLAIWTACFWIMADTADLLFNKGIYLVPMVILAVVTYITYVTAKEGDDSYLITMLIPIAVLAIGYVSVMGRGRKQFYCIVCTCGPVSRPYCSPLDIDGSQQRIRQTAKRNRGRLSSHIELLRLCGCGDRSIIQLQASSR